MFGCQPASLPTGTDPGAYTTMYIAFKLSENTCYFYWPESLLFQSQYSLYVIACPLFIHSNQLILLETKVLTFYHSVNIPYKVLTYYSKQLG